MIFSPNVPTNYPAQYIDRYFITDWCRNWMQTFQLSNPMPSLSMFGSGPNFGQVLAMSIGNDGNIYFLRFDQGSLYRLEYTVQSAPQIVNQPVSRTVNAGDPFSFSVTASGAAPLTYQWQLNGVNVAGATSASYSVASATASMAGTYRCVVSNGFGSVTSAGATLTVNAFNASPVPRISLPLGTQRWNVGDIINYAGTATDAEDGVLAPSAFEWEVRLFHRDCPTCEHWHPGPNAPDGVASGTFEAGNGGEPSPNIWLRLLLIVRDSQGRIGMDSVDLIPNKVNLSFATVPANLTLSAGANLNVEAPFTREFVVNAPITLSAPPTASIGGASYAFTSWSHGGAASSIVAVPSAPTGYTATYTMVSNTQSPFGGTPATIPGTVLAQNYDLGGQGIAFNDLTAGNSGNQYRTTEAVDIEPCSEGQFNIGWVSTGEWTEYTVNVTQSGNYSVGLRVATPFTGRTAHLEWNGVNISGPIAIPVTGSYQAWQTVTVPSVALSAGTHVLRLAMDSENFNISRMVFTLNTVNTPPTVSITSPANNASFSAPATVVINAAAADANGTVTRVEFYQGNVRLGEDLSAPYSFTWSNVFAGSYSLTAVATDNNGASTTSAPISMVVNAPSTQSPYGGLVKNIPGRIEAEEYDLGGSGIAFLDGTAGNAGGVFRSDAVDIQPTGDVNGAFNIGWTTAGEWLEYSVNVVSAGVYTLNLRVASINTGRTCTVEMDGINISGTITIPNTGGWQSWQTVSVPNVNLTAGNKIMRLNFIGGGMNVNFLSFTSSAVASIPAITTDTEESVNTSGLRIFPNPTSSQLHVHIPANMGVSELRITNVHGEVMKKKSITNSDQSEVVLDCSELTSGVYFLNFVNGEKTITEKFVVK
jgi:hypothetical protein